MQYYKSIIHNGSLNVDSATEHSVLTTLQFRKTAAIARLSDHFLNYAGKAIKRLFSTKKVLTFLSVICLSLFLNEKIFSFFDKGLVKDIKWGPSEGIGHC